MKTEKFFPSLIICVIIFFIAANSLFSASTGTIKGVVKDSATGKPLPGANVLIKGTSIGAASNLKGEYFIPRVPPGRYSLLATFIGYKPSEVEVRVDAGTSIEQDFKLEFDVLEGETVEVTAQAEGQLAAINQQLSARTIKNVVASDRLEEIPDANAAESVGRLPGVSIKRSSGEASEVVVRGLTDGFVTVEIDGIKVAPTSEDRGVGLAMITPNMLDGIELTKAITPDMDGDATAGVINFKLKKAPNGLNTRFLIQGGYSDQENIFGMPKADLSLSNRFFNDKLGVFGQLSYFRANRGTDFFSAEYDLRPTPSKENEIVDLEISSMNLQDRKEIRDRYGFALVLDYALPNGKIFFRNFGSRLLSDQITRSNNYQVQDKQIKSNIGFRENQKTDILSNSISGEHQIIGGLFDWTMSHSRQIRKEPRNWNLNTKTKFTNLADSVVLYDREGPENIPDFIENLDANNIRLQTTSYESEQREATEYTVKLNMEMPYHISNTINGNLKLGVKYKRHERSRSGSKSFVDLEDQSWIGAELKKYFPDFKTDEEDLFTFSNLIDPDFKTGEFLDGQYKFRIPADEDLTRTFLERAREYEWPNIDGRADNYENRENYYSAYVMSEINLGSSLTFIPGVRLEYTEHDYDTFLFDENVFSYGKPVEQQGTFTPVSAFEIRRNWLPMLHVKYEPFDWCNIRYAYTTTLRRPNFNQLSPRQHVNTSSNDITLGNPDLEVQVSKNNDLHVSFFGNYIGLFTVGGFYKNISNLIYDSEFTALTKEEAQSYNPQLRKLAEITTFDNITEDTWVKGIEFEWQTRFWYLPIPFSGLVLNVNYSYIQSQTYYPFTERIVDTSVFPPTQYNNFTSRKNRINDQSDHLGNLSIGYDIGRFSTRITALYQGNTLTNADRRYLVEDQIQEKLFRWDIKVTQKITNQLQLIFDFNNITDWPDQRVMRHHTFDKQKEFYGWQGFCGLRYTM